MARDRKRTDRETETEIDELKLKELEDLARGFEGSSGDISLAADLTDVYTAIGGDIDQTTDTGNGSILVPADKLCEVVLGEVTNIDETTGRRRAMGLAPKRSGGARSRLEKETNTRGAVEPRGPKTPDPSNP